MLSRRQIWKEFEERDLLDKDENVSQSVTEDEEDLVEVEEYHPDSDTGYPENDE